MNYLVDPASSYVEHSGSGSSLDSLNYPYETLTYRGGDCDDLSILFCSLLEALEIKTAFITIPGHIYMAFDAGIDAETTVPDIAGLIFSGGKYWLPLEITVPDEGFAEAWRMGIREWDEAEGERALYPMEDSWLLYRPVSVAGAGNNLPVMPEELVIQERFKTSIKNIRSIYYGEQ
jgi:hypothetical protein